MTNQDESNVTINGNEDKLTIDKSQTDIHPDLGDDDTLTTSTGQTRLDDNESQTSFENDNGNGQAVKKDDGDFRDE